MSTLVLHGAPVPFFNTFLETFSMTLYSIRPYSTLMMKLRLISFQYPVTYVALLGHNMEYLIIIKTVLYSWQPSSQCQ